MSTIANNKGGIYFFYIRPGKISDDHQFLMYIGRARFTQHQSIKKRLRSYKNEIESIDRGKVHKLLKNWKDYVFIRYVELEDNDVIDSLEKNLIISLLPPCNSAIPDQEIQQCVSAFS